MDKIIEINNKKIFSLEEANELVPLILHFTKSSQSEVKKAMGRFESLADKTSPQGLELEKEINQIIDKWHIKIEKLGGQPKGLWLADFDFGGGYYCWKYPETKIDFWHGYKDGFLGRKEISNASRNSSNQSNPRPLQSQ